MKRTENREKTAAPVAGLTGWLLERWKGVQRSKPKLALLERITLAPRQSLALVEAEGRRFLIATSPEGAPAFYALDERSRNGARSSSASQASARVSW